MAVRFHSFGLCCAALGRFGFHAGFGLVGKRGQIVGFAHHLLAIWGR